MDAKSSAPLSTAWLGVLCLVVAVVSLTWQGWDMFGARHRSLLKGWDDSFYYFWLPSVVIDHDLDFTNQLADSGAFNEEIRHYALSQPPTPSGLMPNKYPPGWALGSLPFFLLAHAFAPEHSTGFEPIYVTAVWAGQLLYAGLGLWLASVIIARYFSPSIARAAVLVGWLVSPLIYYQTVRLAMSHSQLFTLGMAVFWLSLEIEEREARTRHWALLGFCAAFLFITRNVAIVYLVLPGIVAVRKLRSLRAVAAVVLGAALPLLIQIGAWRILFGSWLVHSYGGERFDFAELHLAEVLFSPRHGWFYWHPLLLPAIAAFAFWARNRVAGRAWLISFFLIVVLNAAWSTWWLGLSFGYRGLEISIFFAMVGLATLLQAAGNHPLMRRVLQVVIVVAIVWNLLLLALFITHRIPSEEAVTYGDVCRATLDWLGLAG